jgi:hypothetical protein
MLTNGVQETLQFDVYVLPRGQCFLYSISIYNTVEVKLIYLI